MLTDSLLLQTDRYAEYPKLKELVERKDGLIAARATPPTFLKACELLQSPSVLLKRVALQANLRSSIHVLGALWQITLDL